MEEKRYYVYVLMDPRKPGKFEYVLQRGKKVTFDFEPFYVGKGTGKRVDVHVNDARNTKHQSHKLNKIRKIESLGLQVLTKVSRPLSNQSALDYEYELVSTIGRMDFGDGPLTNLVDGGGKATNMSPKSIAKRAKSIARAHAARSPEMRKEVQEKINKGLRKFWARVDADKTRKHLADSMRAWWDNMTPEQRADHHKVLMERSAKVFGRMTEAEYAAWIATRSFIAKNWWQNADAATLAQYKDKQREAQAKVWAGRTEEDRKAHGQLTQDTINGYSKKRRKQIIKNRAEGVTKWYHEKSEEEKAEIQRKLTAGKQNYQIQICPHCEIQGRGGNMKRFHFDNCRSLRGEKVVQRKIRA